MIKIRWKGEEEFHYIKKNLILIEYFQKAYLAQ